MKTLLLGATGATGRLLVEQLLQRNVQVKAIVRSEERLPESVRSNPNLELITGNVLDMDVNQMSEIVKDCTSGASCLGHNITLKGVFGPPRKLVRDSVKLTCEAILQNNPQQPVKLVLMNTVGNRNRDLNENYSLGDRVVIGLTSWLVPPQADNEQAAECLRTLIGHNNPQIEWAAVRPDTLIDADEVSEYDVHQSPIESPIFGKRQTSRINVAHFMADLITDPQLWEQWKGKMPVVYNNR